MRDNGIDFILNEGIAEDMYPEYELMLQPLVKSTCETLMMYKYFSKCNPILSCRILDSNELEVMLSEGLGQYIDAYTKNQIIFENAKLIAEILGKVMGNFSNSEISVVPAYYSLLWIKNYLEKIR